MRKLLEPLGLTNLETWLFPPVVDVQVIAVLLHLEQNSLVMTAGNHINQLLL